jgi:alkyl hydroperoxide reductase subunit AhpF
VPLLSADDQRNLKNRFRKELKQDVTINLFTVRSAGLLVVPGRECPTCPQAQELVQEVTALSPKLHLELIDFYTQTEVAQARGVERVPCITLMVEGQPAPQLRFYGIPAGYEFTTLLEGIISLSREVSPLRVPTRKVLRKLDQDVRLQVFVTPG